MLIVMPSFSGVCRRCIGRQRGDDAAVTERMPRDIGVRLQGLKVVHRGCLDDPVPGYGKNSLNVTTGLTCTLP